MTSLTRTPLTPSLYYQAKPAFGQSLASSNPVATPGVGFMGSGEHTARESEVPSAEVLRSQRLPLKAQAPRFGSLLPYDGPYNHAIFASDFADGTSNAESILSLDDTLQFVQGKRQANETIEGFPFSKWTESAPKAPARGSLHVLNLNDIPGGNTAYASITLQRLAGSRRNNDIFIHVTDPGVGNGSDDGIHDRSLLITENHGLFIGPNNGSLGLLTKALEEKGEEFQLYPVDIKKVEAFDKIRSGDPGYQIPETFHGRDLFTVLAGAIAGGINPVAFADLSRKNYRPVTTEFSKSVQTLPSSDFKSLTIYGVRDNTRGNLKTGLVLTQVENERLLAEGALFEVYNEAQPDRKLILPFKQRFSDVPQGKPLAYLGSSYETREIGLKRRFVEIAINNGDASEALGIDASKPERLVLRRIQ